MQDKYKPWVLCTGTTASWEIGILFLEGILYWATYTMVEMELIIENRVFNYFLQGSTLSILTTGCCKIPLAIKVLMSGGALTEGVRGTTWHGSLNSLKWTKVNIYMYTISYTYIQQFLGTSSYINPMSTESNVSATFEQKLGFVLSNSLLVSALSLLVTPNIELSIAVGKAVGSGRSTRTGTKLHIIHRHG